MQIHSIDDSISRTSYATASTNQCNSDGTFRGNEVTITFNTFYRLTEAENRVIGRHELGHAYGLDHVSGGCHDMTVPIVWVCNGSRPSSDDVAGVTALY